MGLGAKNFKRDSLRAARLGDWGWGLGEVGGDVGDGVRCEVGFCGFWSQVV